jgi:hypothetical protein
MKAAPGIREDGFVGLKKFGANGIEMDVIASGP